MDLEAFKNAALNSRQFSVDVPELAEFFSEGEPAEWVVRGLTAGELFHAKEQSDTGLDNMRAMIDALAAEDGDKAGAIRDAMGLSDKGVPAEVSRRIEMLRLASVSPDIKEHREIAVKLSEMFPVLFTNLTNEILRLTGEGAELGKRRGYGPTPK